MLKVLHLADIHARDKDYGEVKKCLLAIVETAKEEKPDIIVHAGDTIDSQNIKLDSRSTKMIFDIFNQLADIAPVAVVIGTPSHDGHAVEVLKYMKAKYPIWVSEVPEMLYVYEGNIHNFPAGVGKNPDAVISMIPTPTKKFFKNDDAGIEQTDKEIGNAMSALFAGFGSQASKHECPHIMNAHFQVGGAYVSDSQQLKTGIDIEVSKDQLAMANADLLCFGHIHLAQEIMPNAFYSGEIRCMEYRKKPHKTGFYIHEIRKIDGLDMKSKETSVLRPVESRFIETPSRKLVKAEIDLIGKSPLSHTCLASYILDEIGIDHIKDASVKIEIKVYQNDVEKIDKKQIEETLIEDGSAADVDVHPIIIPRVNVRSEKILHLETLPDKLKEMARLNEDTVPDAILSKAHILETQTHEDIIKQIKEL